MLDKEEMTSSDSLNMELEVFRKPFSIRPYKNDIGEIKAYFVTWKNMEEYYATLEGCKNFICDKARDYATNMVHNILKPAIQSDDSDLINAIKVKICDLLIMGIYVDEYINNKKKLGQL